MQLTIYENAELFLSRTRVELEKQEVKNGLLLGIILRLQQHPEATASIRRLGTDQSVISVLICLDRDGVRRGGWRYGWLRSPGAPRRGHQAFKYRIAGVNINIPLISSDC